MTFRDDAEKCVAPWYEQPRTLTHLHATALVTMFLPCPENNHFRKFFATVVLLVWATVTVLWAFGAPVSSPFIIALTAVVCTLLGKLWDLEVDRLARRWDISIQPGEDDERRK